ncbi:uncharacterized protein [Apostichopus japonicus]|uniref:uncharacterized protein n=1 Tax=Stichopus japonicus TaxID=307972 RepID=UPI003AB8951C
MTNATFAEHLLAWQIIREVEGVCPIKKLERLVSKLITRKDNTSSSVKGHAQQRLMQQCTPAAIPQWRLMYRTSFRGTVQHSIALWHDGCFSSRYKGWNWKYLCWIVSLINVFFSTSRKMIVIFLVLQ